MMRPYVLLLLVPGLLSRPAGGVPQSGDLPVRQEAYLKAPVPGASYSFGQSVAVAGNTMVVGAPFDATTTSFAGAAYVFVRDAGAWSLQARLEAPIPVGGGFTGETFGGRVAISGDTVVVGASPPQFFTPTERVYVFARSGVSWSHQATLVASNLAVGDFFGSSVAADGDTVVVGAYGEMSNATGVNGDQTSNAAATSGAAYVFVRDGVTWSQQAYLKASNTGAGDRFGFSVAISGDTISVGANQEDSSATGVGGLESDDSADSSGAVYVFARDGTTWSQEAYIKASNTQPFDAFGVGVALSGDTLVVAATGEDSNATGVDGNQTSNAAPTSGAAYVFVREGASWSQEAYLKASNTGSGDNFGFSVSLADDTLVVGAAREDSGSPGVNGDESDNSLADSGAAYLFRREGTSWSQEAYLKASVPGNTDFFGASVATADDRLVVGAHLEDAVAANSGAAYVFELGQEAVVAFRNAGSNPASYAAAAIETGGTFSATVDNNLAAELTSLLFAYDTPISLTLGSGQTLLCLDFGSGELFTGSNLAPTSSALGVDSYVLAVPADPSLAGLAFSSQAIQFGVPPFTLSNALDFTIGGF